MELKIRKIAREKLGVDPDISTWFGSPSIVDRRNTERIIIIGRCIDKIFDRAPQPSYRMSQLRQDVDVITGNKKPLTNISLDEIEADFIEYILKY